MPKGLARIPVGMAFSILFGRVRGKAISGYTTSVVPNEKRREQLRSGIPYGFHCCHKSVDGTSITPCVFWRSLSEKVGCCEYLNIADSSSNDQLLWDRVKACNVHVEPMIPIKFKVSEKEQEGEAVL